MGAAVVSLGIAFIVAGTLFLLFGSRYLSEPESAFVMIGGIIVVILGYSGKLSGHKGSHR